MNRDIWPEKESEGTVLAVVDDSIDKSFHPPYHVCSAFLLSSAPSSCCIHCVFTIESAALPMRP